MSKKKALWSNEALSKKHYIRCPEASNTSTQFYFGRDDEHLIMRQVRIRIGHAAGAFDLMPNSHLIASWDSGMPMLAYREYVNKFFPFFSLNIVLTRLKKGHGRVISASFGCRMTDVELSELVLRSARFVARQRRWTFQDHSRFIYERRRQVELLWWIVSRWNERQPRFQKLVKPLFAIICNHMIAK